MRLFRFFNTPEPVTVSTSVYDKLGTTQDDTFTGNNLPQQFFGGPGSDTVDYSASRVGVQVNLARGEGHNGAADGDRYKGIENATGSQSNDIFVGTDQNNTLIGLDGNDQFNGSKGNDTLVGGAGRDTVNYQPLDQGIVMDLEAGTVDKGGTNGADSISGIEAIKGTRYDDSLRGSDADESFNGGRGDDFLSGLDGDDFLSGDQGNDRLDGGGGDDILAFSGGNDVIDGGTGTDTLSTSLSSGADVSLQEGIATISGFQATISNIENVRTGFRDDTVEGDENDNEISTNAGNDILNGLGGNDTLEGGAGADTFVFLNEERFGTDLDHGNDVITDFMAGLDKIDLSGTEVRDFQDLLNYDPNGNPSEFGDRFMVQEGEDVIIYTKDGLEGDSITLQNTNLTDLSANDFVF